MTLREVPSIVMTVFCGDVITRSFLYVPAACMSFMCCCKIARKSLAATDECRDPINPLTTGETAVQQKENKINSFFSHTSCMHCAAEDQFTTNVIFLLNDLSRYPVDSAWCRSFHFGSVV